MRQRGTTPRKTLPILSPNSSRAFFLFKKLLKVPDFGRLFRPLWPFLVPLQCSRHLKRKILWHSVACAVAVRTLAVVQCTSMVALAPNTSETSSWDVLETFPKLHSRAREVKTRICTEAPHSKSFGRVEIWQAIYESCDGLESFTRDPIGLNGGRNIYGSYLGLKWMDPTGLHIKLTPATLPKGQPWSNEPLPYGVAGETTVNLDIQCPCVKCKTCAGFYVSWCTIDVSFNVTIDVAQARQHSPPTPVPPGWSQPEWTYGHEQRHIENMINEIKSIMKSLDKKITKTCTTAEQCEIDSLEMRTQAFKEGQDYWDAEGQHKHPPFNTPDGPSDGFPPIGPMPSPTK